MERTIIKTAVSFKKHSRIIIIFAVIVSSALIIGCTSNKTSSDKQGTTEDIYGTIRRNINANGV